jgi:hypothetical protein
MLVLQWGGVAGLVRISAGHRLLKMLWQWFWTSEDSEQLDDTATTGTIPMDDFPYGTVTFREDAGHVC